MRCRGRDCSSSISVGKKIEGENTMQIEKSIDTFVSDKIEEKAEILTSVSDQIWGFAEIMYEEEQSAELMCHTLEQEGFEVERGAGNIPTACVGEFGNGGTVIGILGEYDALPNLSQAAGESTRNEIEVGGHGHGCGHNLLGTSSLAAAIAVKEYIEENNLEATVRFYGCPAEEGGSGKAHMAKAGLFDDVDIALSWHPGDTNRVQHARMLATCSIKFSFHGASSHAAADPHLGRSALDAVDLFNVGSNFLREHIIQEARLHYAIINTGGNAPNVVQNEAEVLYLIRAPEAEQVQDIMKRVIKVAEGAALMTETTVDYQVQNACASLIPNEVLASTMNKHFQNIGANSYTEEEKVFAKELQATFIEEQEEVFHEEVDPMPDEPGFIPASTDVGDVSWLVPTGQISAATIAKGTPGHSWQLVAQGKTTSAKKGMLLAGKVIAAAAIDLLLDPEKVEQAKEEHKKQLNGKEYVSLIPEGTKPTAQ